MGDESGQLEQLHRAVPAILLELEQREQRNGLSVLPRATARLLATLVHCMQANRVLEIGTAYGYATLWMALAQPPAGRIWTIDPDMERTQTAATYFARAGKRESVEFINQPALEVLPVFPQRNMDMVFINAAETEYEAYLELSVALLKRSGLVLVNNLLQDSAVIRSFNEAFLHHPALDATIVPVGAGLGIGARIQ
ncbi:MAG: hypothetical protein DLM50_07635 [Candidatus Meridianibacter frigidus]|nr:MAG: hypothetical protein DLM50_07635 [Candidatus Eremiobacteraeota bacterium]